MLFPFLFKMIEGNETFSFNSEFSSKFRRIKIPLIAASKEFLPEDSTNGELPAVVEDDRKHQSEAAIVRIMKSRRTLSHNSLIAEVYRQISSRFSPTAQVLLNAFQHYIYIILSI